MFSIRLLCLGIAAAWAFPICLLHAAEWPKTGFILYGEATSPDGRYGVLIPNQDAEYKEGKMANYLVDVKSKQVLGRLSGVYWEQANKFSLTVRWADDSSWAGVAYSDHDRVTVSLVEITGAQIKETRIGERIQRDLEAAFGRKADGDTGSSAWFRIDSVERKARVRVLEVMTPKTETDDVSRALFQGTYDLTAKEWTATEARKFSNELNDDLQSAYEDETVFDSFDEATEQALDERLNVIYRALRGMLPAEKFTVVKQEQIAWLKTRDAARGLKSRCELIAARIAELKNLLW